MIWKEEKKEIYKMKTFLLFGQTDSGKSTIGGHILYQQNYFAGDKDYRVLINNTQSSDSKSRFSVLLDIYNDGEILVNKTKTQSYTIYDFQYNKEELRMIDTPGHKLYITSVLDGLYSSKIDVVCLVISSITSEFRESLERGTVKEDLMISRVCKELIIVFNKIDIVHIDPSMQQEIVKFCKKLRYNVRVCHVSGITGDGLDNLLDMILDTPHKEQVIEDSIITNKFTTRVSFHTSSVISAGFKCILHSRHGTTSVEIEKIHCSKPFILADTNPYVIDFIGEPLLCSNGERIILRTSNETIGFGVFYFGVISSPNSENERKL